MKTKESTMRKQQNSNRELDVSEDQTTNERNHEEVNEDENPNVHETRTASSHRLPREKGSQETPRESKKKTFKESDDETKEMVRENLERSHQTGKKWPQKRGEK